MADTPLARRLISISVTSALAALGATVVLVAQAPGAGAGHGPAWELVSATLVDDDGDGYLAPGEGAWVGVTVRNLGSWDREGGEIVLAGEGLVVGGQPDRLAPVAAGLSRQCEPVRVRRDESGEDLATLDVALDGAWLGALDLPRSEERDATIGP